MKGRKRSMLLKTKVTDKSLRGDILVEFGRFKVNLECYNIFDQNSYNKSLNYVLRIFSTIIERGQKKYNNNERILGINLIANIVSKNTFLGDAICSKVVLEHKEKNNTHELPNVGIYFYRLDKIDAYSKNEKRKKWLEFIRAKDYEERAIIAKGDEKMEALNEWVEEYINDERTKKLFGEWNRYIDMEKMKRINIGIGMEKGIAKGKKIGLAEGLVQGEQKGLAKGEQKFEQFKIRSVKTMKKNKIPDETIAEELDIPINDVKKIL